MRHYIKIKYFQQGADPDLASEDTKIWYTVELKAETYMKALEYCGNIASACKGAITETIIEKLADVDEQ